MNIICEYCGKKIKDDNNCRYCGAPFQVRLEIDEELIPLSELILVAEYQSFGHKKQCYERHIYDVDYSF